MLHTIKTSMAATLALGVGLVAFPFAGHAVTTTQTFVQTSDDSTNQQVGTSTGNQITVTDLLNGSLDIKVTLASGFQFVNTGAGGTGGSFVFGLSGISSLTFTPVTPSTFEDPPPPPATWFPTGSVVPTASSDPVTVAAASLSASGKYIYSSGYGLSYEANGASQPFTTPLEFTITNSTTNLTLAIFLADLQSSTNSTSTGLCTGPSSSGCFYADVINNNSTATDKTGLIDFGLRSTEGGGGGNTPLPAAVWLMGSILGGGASVGAWRRRKQRAKAA